MTIFSFSFQGMVKDGGLDPSTTCKIAAQQLAADPDIVGVVGGLRSSCSIASHQYFRDHGNTFFHFHSVIFLVIESYSSFRETLSS